MEDLLLDRSVHLLLEEAVTATTDAQTDEMCGLYTNAVGNIDEALRRLLACRARLVSRVGREAARS